MKKTILILSLLILLSACSNAATNDSGNGNSTANPGQNQNTGAAKPSPAPAETNTDGEEQPVKAKTEQEAAAAVILALKDADLATLASYIHPDKGLLFSPYAHIETVSAKVFQAADLPAMSDPTVYNWGSYDGTGEPIELTFQQYYDKFVYGKDFMEAETVGVNEIKGMGNTLVNIEEVFPGSFVMDYYFSGFDKQYEGMDWESLILVLEEFVGAWYVSAIVHSQWTI
ncbi:hypothetical protein L1N85_11100 [Paenibacillus alkaliterrae]|uniref:hypothetical protein n=1 Tax=Paenibacillus alkaliterrae TaxID=320909 RepID=UPI001F2B2BDF|nr:hypothetical protein [Paenibacillus alkaliterrae]MCF2938983.1 hypothetical protein [Paenibacillus alkaliterrae]